MDVRHCEWCLFVLHRIRPADHPHHVFGRHNPVTVDLCAEHHMVLYHTSGKITRERIVKEILIPHKWRGRDLSATYTKETKTGW